MSISRAKVLKDILCKSADFSHPKINLPIRFSYQRFFIHQLMHKQIVLKTTLRFTFKKFFLLQRQS